MYACTRVCGVGIHVYTFSCLLSLIMEHWFTFPFFISIVETNENISDIYNNLYIFINNIKKSQYTQNYVDERERIIYTIYCIYMYARVIRKNRRANFI